MDRWYHCFTRVDTAIAYVQHPLPASVWICRRELANRDVDQLVKASQVGLKPVCGSIGYPSSTDIFYITYRQIALRYSVPITEHSASVTKATFRGNGNKAVSQRCNKPLQWVTKPRYTNDRLSNFICMYIHICIFE